MTLKPVLALLIGAAAWPLLQRFSQSRRRSRLSAPANRKHQAVSTWEGEGGALHGTGAQLGPDPHHP